MTKQERRWQKWMDVMAPSCHQRSDRSFFYHGWQFPVCARCTGLYLGYVIGIISIALDLWLSVWLCVMGLFVLWLDWILQYQKICGSTNIRRFVTGLWCGVSIITLIGYSISFVGRM